MAYELAPSTYPVSRTGRQAETVVPKRSAKSKRGDVGSLELQDALIW